MPPKAALIQEGDSFSVQIDEVGAEYATVTLPDGEIRIYECDATAGETVKIEVTRKTVNHVEAVPADRPPLSEQFSPGDILTVDVDYVEGRHAYVDIDHDRRIQITAYKQTATDIPIKVRSIYEGRGTVTARRLVEIDQLSMTALHQADQPAAVRVEYTNVTDDDLRVFLSHLIAAENWTQTNRLLREWFFCETINLQVATELIANADGVSSDMWADILYTVLQKVPELAPNVSVEYHGAILSQRKIPAGWVETVAANANYIMKAHEVESKYTSIPQTTKSPSVDTTSLLVGHRTRSSRNTNLARKIKEEWEGKCAVCANCMESPHGHSGLETAHIYPVRLGGPDKIGNLLPLCVLHHWAFDNGWLTITDRLTVQLRESMSEDIRSLLAVEDDTPIIVPNGYTPKVEYLGLHRQIHGFSTFYPGDRLPISIEKFEFRLKDAVIELPNGDTLRIPLDYIDEEGENRGQATVIDVAEGTVTIVPTKQSGD